MNLPGFCIHRPAFTIVISLVMFIIGLIGYVNLPLRWIPNVTHPVISIQVSYPGANARLMEHDVTKVIEAELSGINGIETLTSRSSQGQSEIMLNFALGANLNTALDDVRSCLDRVRSQLPQDITNPVVSKQDNSQMPILFISFYDPKRSQRELSDYVDKYIVPTFETIDGVGSVVIFGKRISAMHIRLNPTKLASANVTTNEVTQLLQQLSSSIPAGQIKERDRLYSVMMDTSLKTPEQFNNLIIRDYQNQALRLKDIGEAKLDPENSDSAFRINGKPAVALGILPQSLANPLDVEKSVQKVFADIKHSLPAGIEARIDYNQADFIRASIHSVYESFFEAVIFVWLVILAFLCNFRATFIPIITIPVCLVSTFALLYFFGFSINTITLMAFVLAIGLVVDDAIVILENISRHIEQGLQPVAAALKGSREMIFPIIAMTLTLSAVYTPIAFTSGLLGILFREFTVTLAGAVIISGIIALTLSPMMCSRILKSNQQTNRYNQWLIFKMTQLQHGYRFILQFLLKRRLLVITFLMLIALLGFVVYKYLPAELAPAENMNEIDVFASAPQSASFNYTNFYEKQLEDIYAKIPDINAYFSIVGMGAPNNSFQILELKPARRHSSEQILQTIMAQANTITGLNVNAFLPPPPLAEFAGSDEGDNIGLVIMTSGDYLNLHQISTQILEEIKKVPGFVHADSMLKWDSEQFHITIDQEKIADLQIPLSSITNMISTLLAGKTLGKVEDANIIVQMDDASLANPAIFNQLYIRNTANTLIPLANFISIDTVSSPNIFPHFNKLRAESIYITPAPGFKIADAIQTLQKILREKLPDNMKYTFTGEAKSFLESNGKTLFTFLLAIIFIYLVLVAQFESFIDPLVIMLTVPFAMVGAMITLKTFSGSLNIYSNIGLITLIGLIAKHGILITEFANGLRAQGLPIQDAIVEASLMRLRPILMTTAAMVLGALPLALAFGPGAESRQQIGFVIVGGMLFGTIFSLIVVPITYTFLAPFRKIINVTSAQELAHDTIL